MLRGNGDHDLQRDETGVYGGDREIVTGAFTYTMGAKAQGIGYEDEVTPTIVARGGQTSR